MPTLWTAAPKESATLSTKNPNNDKAGTSASPHLGTPLILPGEHHHPTLFERFRRLMIAGLLVIIPAVIAVYAVLFIMGLADAVFGGFVDSLFMIRRDTDLSANPLYQPTKTFIAFLLACFAIMFVGWLSTFLLVRRIIHFGERIVSRVPLVKFFYNTPKEVLHTFTSSRKDSNKRVVLFEYPRRGIWSIGFATGEVIKKPEETPLVAIFLPTTPNPTSGYLLLVPAEDVYDTNIPVEDGARLIISGGILAPEDIWTQRFAGLSKVPSMPPPKPLLNDQIDPSHRKETPSCP